ncbi:MAG: hypothetical protein GEV09_12235 [Pseudonocardiaceae bacterium]|nr:hypothetical protein [Pseudonocardiaceae bacterium]
MARGTGWPAGVLALAVVGLLAVSGWLVWPSGADYRSAPATVVESAECGPSDASDVVRVDLEGRAVAAALDACGHRVGARVTVEILVGAVRDGMTVRLAGTGVPAGATTAQRVAAVLLVVAGGAGALLGWQLSRRRR